VKLHGSVVLAHDLTVVADNRYDPGTADTNYQGKLTFVSNMNETSVNDYMPLLSNPSNGPDRVHVGVTTNDPVLKAPSFYDAAIQAPLVPELKSGPAVAGILKTNYWNKGLVDSSTPIQTKNGVELYFLTGADSVYKDFNQVVVKNAGLVSVRGMFLRLMGYPPLLINETGNMQPGDVWTTLVHTSLTVAPALMHGATIIDQPDSIGCFPGTINMRFSVVAEGDPVLSYKWYKDLDEDGEIDPGEELPEVSPDLTFPVVHESDQGFYFCTVTNDARTVQSNSAYLDVYDGPTITDNPDPLTVWPGESATFSVSATGIALTYRWQFRKSSLEQWQNIPLAITASYTIPADPNPLDLIPAGVQEANEGEYRCRVTNPVSTAESAPAMLTVNDVPQIVKHPEDVVAPLNSDVSMYIVAVGTTLQYRWERDHNNDIWELVPGATDSILHFSPLLASHAGHYRCRIANVSKPYDDTSGLGGGVLSNTAVLSVGDPGIISQPLSKLVNPLDDVEFKVVPITAGSLADLSYQWYKNNVAINPVENPTALSTKLEIKKAEEADEGAYKVKITGPGGNVTSAPATLTVRNLPRIVVDPACPPTVQIGETVNMGVLVEFDPQDPVSYQWRYKNPMTQVVNEIPGAESSIHTIQHAIQKDEGLYTCAVSNLATTNTGPVVSREANLIVGHLLDIVNVAGGGVFCEKTGPAEFSVTTEYGRGPRTYQWLRDGTPVGLSVQSEENVFTFNSFEIAEVTMADMGEYICKITDERGNHYTEPVELTVTRGVQVEDISGGGVAYKNDRAWPFSITTRFGCGTRTYQWMHNGAPVGPQGQSSEEHYTFDAFVLDPVTPDSAGTYMCRIMDDGGRYDIGPLTLEVFDHITAPRILVDHQEVTAEAILRTRGDSIRFEAVGAEGGKPPLTYEWLVEDAATKSMKADPPMDPIWEIDELDSSYTGWYSVRVHDSGTDDAVSAPVLLKVSAGVPAAGGLTFAVMTALCAASGALMLRRRRKQ